MTPLVLVVGFLGAGKTTFLKSLVPLLSQQGIRPGLLINDFHNARVDAEQFRDLIDEVKALNGDCVCCGSRDQLFEELHRFQHGPDRVMLIETNGTAEPGSIIEALALDPALGEFTQPIQVSIVDVERWQKRFWHNALEREQARTASHVFLSREQAVPPARLEDVRASLQKCGVRGPFVTVTSFAAELAGQEIREPAGSRLGEPAHECCGCSGHHHGEDEPEERHHAANHFSSHEIALPDRVERKPFVDFLKSLPEEVIRAKGLVRFEEDPSQFFVFQKVDRDVQFFPVGPAPRLSVPLALFVGPKLDLTELQQRVLSLPTPSRG